MSDELLFGDGPRVAVIGLGLIGGSVVLRCVARGLEVIGYDADAATRAMAAQHFPVATSLADVVVNADLVVLAVPLCTMADTAQKIAAAIGPGNRVRVNPGISQKPGLTLTRSVPGIEKRPTITDVGSVKVPVRAALNAAGLGELYVGGHPMAGNEHSGFEYADPMLLVGAPWVLTRPANVWRFGTVFQWVTDTFDASVIELTDAEHDEVQALVSGLPHVLAVELLNQLWDSPSGKTAQKLIAGSFRDGTRVAFTDPERTKALVQENATNIVPLIRKTAQNLTALADALENQGDAAEFFHHADTLRNSAG